MAVNETKIRAQALARVMNALGHPHRIYIMHRLTEAPCTIADLASGLGSSSPSISKHLRILRNVGLIDRKKDGVVAHYFALCTCVPTFHCCVENLLQVSIDEIKRILD